MFGISLARRNFMTPLPRFANWDAFNGHLEEQCRNRQGNVLRGHRESIGERFVRDREALKRPLPAPFDACDKQGTRVNSLSLVRYRTNDYSVPVAYGTPASPSSSGTSFRRFLSKPPWTGPRRGSCWPNSDRAANRCSGCRTRCRGAKREGRAWREFDRAWTFSSRSMCQTPGRRFGRSNRAGLPVGPTQNPNISFRCSRRRFSKNLRYSRKPSPNDSRWGSPCSMFPLSRS